MAGCSEGDDRPEPTGTPGLTVLSGAGMTDTTTAIGLPLLSVQVNGPDGRPAAGAYVRFAVQPPLPTPVPSRNGEQRVYVCNASRPDCDNGFGIGGPTFLLDTADAQGRAAARVAFGTISGRGVINVSVPEFAYADSATYTVNPGAPASVRVAVTDTLINIGDTTSARGTVFDRHRNVRPESSPLSSNVGAPFTVNATTGIVTGTALGAQYVFARTGTLVDSVRTMVVPPGRLVTWSNTQSLQLVNTDGTNARPIAANTQSGTWGAMPLFDPTRQRISFQILGTSSQGLNGAPTVIVVQDTSGSPRREILEADTKFVQIFAHRLLSDGSVLIAGLRNSRPFAGVWRVAPDNSMTLVVELVDTGLDYATADISPDGTKIAYLGSNRNGLNELRVMTLASGAQVVVASNARAPRWSKQSDRVVFLTPKSLGALTGFPTIVNADGTGGRQLGTYEVNPGLSWSPDGIYIVGTSSPSFNGFNLRIMRVSDGLSLLIGHASGPGQVSNLREPDWR